jgi:hypothetical protein
MTYRLVAAIFSDAVNGKNSEVAAKYGINETQVRAIFAVESARLLGAHRADADAVILRARNERSGVFVLASDSEKIAVIDAFEGMNDPRLKKFMNERPDRRVHADWRIGPIASVAMGQANMVTVHRISVTERIAALMPVCVVRLRKWLDPDEAAAVRKVHAILNLRAMRRTMRESEALEEVAAASPMLATFLRLVERIYAVFNAPDAGSASRDYTDWMGLLSAKFADIFAPLTAYLAKAVPLAFNDGYGAVSARMWRASDGLNVEARPHDTPRKAVVRALRAAGDSAETTLASPWTRSGRSPVTT